MTLPLLAISSLAAMTALTVHRMRRARFSRVELSTARFFMDEPPSESQRQWVLCPPQWRDRSYLMQMGALLCLLLAAAAEGLTTPRTDGLRVEICIDVSGSMDTQQNDGRRSEIAIQRLRETLDTIESISRDTGEPCKVRLVTFDLDVNLHGPATSDLSTLWALTARDIRPKLIGTDLAALQRHLNRGTSSEHDWSPTHIVVISDQAAPRWAIESNELSVQWLDLARAVDSHGITRIEPEADALTGRLKNVRMHLQAWGRLPEKTSLMVSDGSRDETVPVRWDDDGYARVDFEDLQIFRLRQASHLTLELSGSDAWPHDNRAAVALPDRSDLVVRWQLPDVSSPQLTGWKLQTRVGENVESASDTPSLVVTDFAGLAGVPEHVPVLLIGSPSGVRRSRRSKNNAPEDPEWFVCSVRDDTPFLQDVNLDALERESAIRPESVVQLLTAFRRAGFRNGNLQAEDVRVELMAFPADSNSSTSNSQVALAHISAHEKHGRLVWMPLLPELGTEPDRRGTLDIDAGQAAWQIVFLNAVSWLVNRSDAMLFERTSRTHPQPDCHTPPYRLPLHPGEGDTGHGAKHRTTFDPSLRVTAEQSGEWWQLPLLLALIVLTIERCLVLISGGGK